MQTSGNSDRNDASSRLGAWDSLSATNSNPALQLSRAIGQQDAADRLRAAAEWLDARSDTPCSDDLPMVVAPSSGRRDSLADDDMPLVPPPQHVLAPWPSAVETRPAAARAAQGFVDPRQANGGSSLPAASRVVDYRHEQQRKADLDARRPVGQPSIGQKRPAPNSLGSSASNAIVIDDD